MAHLFINSKGSPHRKHSYSSGNIFDQCPYKYYLMKVLGWKERDNKASFKFGHAVEESVQFYHDHGGQLDIAEDFDRRWAAHKDDTSIKYSAAEKNWETCRVMGRDMVRLYAAVQPKLPIPMGAKSVWQRNYAKEVFPSDPNYGEIEFEGRLDIVCYVDPKHPTLTEFNSTEQYRPLIVDIKTSAVEFPEQPGLAALDAQLRVYSWISGIRDVALLWFVKKGLGYKKGYTVYFIDKVGDFEPGDSGIVESLDGDHLFVVKHDFMLSQPDKYATRVKLTSVTKQMLQFNSGRVTEQSAIDAGRIAGRQIIGIVNAWKTQAWPNTFGIRYPRDDRNDSYFRAFVLGDEAYKKQNFTKSDEESFDTLFQEEPNED